MAYERTNWQNEVTPIDADHLNNIEDGIEEAKDAIEAAEVDNSVITLYRSLGLISDAVLASATD